MRCVCAPQTKYMPLLIDNAAARFLCLLYVVLRPWPARRAHLPKSINRVHRRHYVCVWLRLTLLFNMLPTLINTTATNNNNTTIPPVHQICSCNRNVHARSHRRFDGRACQEQNASGGDGSDPARHTEHVDQRRIRGGSGLLAHWQMRLVVVVRCLEKQKERERERGKVV